MDSVIIALVCTEFSWKMSPDGRFYAMTKAKKAQFKITSKSRVSEISKVPLKAE